ncbi:MAG TPA: AAA family ATPase [Spirochaetia bacterium]|nr:AAA family ATPase [Spirochaetia bacterium]
MFLKTLEIFGFKSFADKVSIDFTDGVAALLGPNGCGKSNVVDAMKWVLGEQSSKALRAENMHDVLFAGSDSRKPLNVAEVTLTVSNQDEVLPLNLPEVSIRRRLYRSGESEYFINGNLVKLRDVRELFFDTGIGKSAYSIMEQGKIDQLLSTKPEERRFVFEEAAGITRFRVRGQEAERKLEKTEENMRHVEGILDEVRRSYNSLKVQAEKAEVYRRLREEIFEVELEIQLLRLKGLLEDRRKREGRLQEKEKARDEIRKAIEEVNASIAQQADLVNSMESQLVESHKRLYQLDMEKNTRDNQVRMYRERVGELERTIEADEIREKNVRHKIEEIGAETSRRETGLADLDARIGETGENISGFTRDIDAFGTRVKANDDQVRANGAAIQGLEATIEELRVELRAITEDIVTQLDARLTEMGYSSAERRSVEESINEALQSLRIQLGGKISILEDAAGVRNVPRVEMEKLVRNTISVLHASLEKVTVLDGLFARYRGFAPSFLDEFLAPEGIITRKRDIDERINENAGGIARLRQHNEELARDNDALRQKIEEYRATLEDLRVNLARLQTQRAGVKEEIERLARERNEQEEILVEVGQQAAETRLKKAETAQRIASAEEERRELEERERAERSALSGLEGEISKRNRDLAAKGEDLKQKNALAMRAQAEIEKMQIEVTEIRTEIKDLRAGFMERFSRDLSEYETRIPDLQPNRDLRPRLLELREEMRKLGQVNLMAPEEFAEVKDRFDFLSGQLTDLTRAKEDLKRVTTEIRTESTELFLDTYNKIRRNFHTVFRRLFGGGRAELHLENPDAPLDSGIEVFAQPPGKKLENINLLSGGERSLTGVSLMFAIYMVKPSPFCLLDEIDAALDEENVGRLTTMLKEFSTNSQFIVITHNKRTVAGADVLYGVTMEESGVSKLVAIRLENRERGEAVSSAAPA